jgi:DNA-binding LytR/AlgR family response regulator
MRVLIADDEEPARIRLNQLLASHPQVEVIAEAENGLETVQLIASMRPDVVFLDVQMPGASGLDVAARLLDPRPAIIFCTAYDQHAVDAFELDAVDYLLKPVSRSRLAESLRRLRSPYSPQVEANNSGISRDRQVYLTRFLVKSGSHYVVIPASRTAFCELVDGLTRITTSAAQSYWIDPSLHELELELDPSRFFRVSRSAIIALTEVLELHPLPGGSAEVVLKRGVRFEVSRRRVRPLISILEKA